MFLYNKAEESKIHLKSKVLLLMERSKWDHAVLVFCALLEIF